MFRFRRQTRHHRHTPPPFQVEPLEGRALLATGTGAFVAPDLTQYVRATHGGARNTSQAIIQIMTSSLENQLNSGPLAALQAGTDTQATFITDVGNLISTYQSNVVLQLSPRFPSVSQVLLAEGTKVGTLIAAAQAQQAAGLITPAQFQIEAADAISSLTAGPLPARHATNAGFAQATQIFEAQLSALTPTLITGATPHLTVTQLQTVVAAESRAYVAALTPSLVGHDDVARQVSNAVTALNNSVANIAATNPADAPVLYSQAVAAFDQALLDTTGLFGPFGAHRLGRGR